MLALVCVMSSSHTKIDNQFASIKSKKRSLSWENFEQRFDLSKMIANAIFFIRWRILKEFHPILDAAERSELQINFALNLSYFLGWVAQ